MNARAAPADRAPGRMAEMGTLMLLDSASLYYRAFYGVPETMTAPDGTPVNAVRGLLDMMRGWSGPGRRPPGGVPGRRLAAGLPDRGDPVLQGAPGQPRRHRAGAGALTAQIPVIRQVLAAAGVAMAAAPGYEADDVIGTLAAREPGRSRW